MVAAAYGGAGARRPRGQPTRLPVLRLDVVVVLLLVFFFIGLYVPGLVGGGGGGGAVAGAEGGGGRALSLFRTGGAAVDPEEWEELQEEVAALGERLAAAEKETKAVMEENARLRLDNKVEQSNLKSLTKAKNEEIKRLTAEAEELRKQQPAGGDKAAGGGEGQGGAECQRKVGELETRVKDLQAQLEGAHEALKRAREESLKVAGPTAPSGGDGRDADGVTVWVDDDDDEHQQQQGQAAQAGAPVAEEQEQEEEQGGIGKAGKGFLSKQLISVPEPQPLNGYWEPRVKELFELALSDPAALLKQLDEEDPLGVNMETVAEFTCPTPEERLTQPDLRRMEIAAQFREGKGFVFFQHLRKAGGTGFCDLASRSMPGKTPAYYCMPDQRGTLATPPWNTSWLLDTMDRKGFRIAANEWDAFPRSKFAIADAVFATVMRDPTDRWYSQYRFEHVEHRDGSVGTQPFEAWYEQQVPYSMGRNYYVKTFAGDENPPDAQVLEKKGPKGVPLAHGNFYWTYDKYRGKQKEAQTVRTWDVFNRAVDTLRRFHLVLVLEWLNDGDEEIERVLDWTAPPRQVLPHESQAQRKEKKSKRARDLLDAKVFQATREDNVLDHLFYHVGRRIFLERYACARAETAAE